DEGLALYREILDYVGVRLPRSPRAALVSLLAHRLASRFRGLGFRERRESEIPPGDLRRIDAMWSVTQGLMTFDAIRALECQSRHFSYALRAGEPYRIAVAVAAQAGSMATGGGKTRKRTATLLGLADLLAERSRNPHAIGLCVSVAAFDARLQGRFRV